MDVLVTIVKNLLIIIVLSSLMEMLLPKGSLNQFVRFAISLFVLIAILNPVLTLIYRDSLAVNSWDYQDNRQLDENLIKKSQQINQKINKNYEDTVKEKIQGQINAITSLIPGIDSVDTKLSLNGDEQITKLELTVKTKSDEIVTDINEVQVNSGGQVNYGWKEEKEITDKIKFLLNNFYALNDAQLDIKFEGSPNYER